MNKGGIPSGVNGYSFEALKKRLVMAHGLGFREEPKVSFSFGRNLPPNDWGAFMRRAFPVRERPVIGYRLSTLARVVGKLPLN